MKLGVQQTSVNTMMMFYFHQFLLTFVAYLTHIYLQKRLRVSKIEQLLDMSFTGIPMVILTGE